MDLKVTIQYGELGIRYRQPQMDIVARVADVEIKQTSSELKLNIDYPQIQIDNTQVLADIGYKKIVPLQEQIASEGRSTLLQGIERVAREGDMIARSLGKGSNIFSRIAWNNMLHEVETNIDILPHVRPQITVTGGMSSDFSPGRVQTKFRPSMPQIDYTPGQVKIYLEKEPYIKIECLGSYIDLVT